MNKFKVGDIVVGNELARRYGITKPGCVIEVLGEIDSKRFRGKLLEAAPGIGYGAIGVNFMLHYDAFNLKEQEPIQENE